MDVTTQTPDVGTLLRWYEQMWTIRYFEENAIRSFKKGLFTGSVHPSISQEAIAVGATAALEAGDQVLGTYRGHGHAIAKGLDPKRIMAEVFSKETGCSGGRGGSMHLFDKAKGFWGTNAIVAAHIPIAGGIALSNKLKKNRRVTLVFFGDGATCEGAFLETLNVATLWKVPLILVCENNGVALSVPTVKFTPIADLSQRADGFGLPGVTVDGNDPLAVFHSVCDAANRARNGAGPTLVECKTVRWERHSAVSAGKFENEEDAFKWKTVDPIPRFEKVLRELGVPEERFKESQDRARFINDEALKFAMESPYPKAETVGDFVFA